MFRDKINSRLQKGGFCRTPSNPPAYGPVKTGKIYVIYHDYYTNIHVLIFYLIDCIVINIMRMYVCIPLKYKVSLQEPQNAMHCRTGV